MTPTRPVAGRAAICQGAQQGSGGPTGAKDDPMHVNVTNPPQGQPQGAAHSSANFGALSGVTTA